MIRSGLLKWSKVILALPLWAFRVILFVQRLILLVLYSGILLAVSIADLFFDIYRSIRNWIYYNFVEHIVNVLLEIWEFFYAIFILPWIVIFNFIGLVLLFIWDVNWWFVTLWYNIDQFFWSIFWFFYDINWNWIFLPLITLTLWVIFLLPNLLISLWGAWISSKLKPFDDWCVFFFKISDATADFFLMFANFPTWQASYFEVPFAIPILAANNFFDNQLNLIG